MTEPLRVALIASTRHPIRQPFAGGLEAHVCHLTRALASRGYRVSLFAAAGSDPGLNCQTLDVRPLHLSDAARRDVSMPPADFMADHHAYLSLMLWLAGPGSQTVRHHPQPQPALPSGGDGLGVVHPDAHHGAHAADALARVGDRCRHRAGDPLCGGLPTHRCGVARPHRRYHRDSQRHSYGPVAPRPGWAVFGVVWPDHPGEGTPSGDRRGPTGAQTVGPRRSDLRPAVLSPPH